MKNILQENFIKNIVVIVSLFFAYPFILTSLSNSPAAIDKAVTGNMLVAVGIIAVIACFGNFAFTYEKVEFKNFGSRLLAHFVTGLLMLVIGLSLEMTSVLSKLLVGNFVIFDTSLIILYFASILYDFWDLKRAHI